MANVKVDFNISIKGIMFEIKSMLNDDIKMHIPSIIIWLIVIQIFMIAFLMTSIK